MKFVEECTEEPSSGVFQDEDDHTIHDKFSNSNSARDFWYLAKNINNLASSSFPPLFHPDGTTAISSVSKAEVFSQTFANNSTMDDSGLVPPSPLPS
ncbi:hypothetical protein E2C01_048041 [Portunus trituberculatus]|uniref:Uncharacterized protein n=1 Tax=Portunus trituberculatus TaxID=210409 RepID=A0A5B7GC60_PORTR|nr:hypothetical protein [Portunus trituberculatus]